MGLMKASISITIQQEDKHEEVDAEDDEPLLVKHVDLKIDEDDIDQGQEEVDLEKDCLAVEVVHDRYIEHAWEPGAWGRSIKKENELVDLNLGEQGAKVVDGVANLNGEDKLDHINVKTHWVTPSSNFRKTWSQAPRVQLPRIYCHCLRLFSATNYLPCCKYHCNYQPHACSFNEQLETHYKF